MNHVAFVFAFVFIGALMGCGGETTPSPRANGEPCTETPQCASGLCYASVCLDPGSDDDGDGLLNEIEVALETRVDLADSDGDGRNDYEETPQPLEPGHSDNDHDGDGVIDALESAYEDGDCDGLGDEVDHPDDAPPADAPAALPCPKDMQSDACTGAQGGAGGSLVGCHCCTDSDLDGVVDLEDCQPGDPTIWDESTCIEVAASQCQTGHCDAYRLTCQRSDPCEASHACEIATCDGLGDGVSPVCTRVDRECALDPCAPESCDPEVGCVCTLYRAVDADVWHEKLELLSYNSEFIVNVIFAEVFGAYDFCPGCSVAIRRKALDEVGGFEPLLDYLVEDFELGRRINARGYRTELIPYFVDTTVDIGRAGDWWSHQVYWDQNTRAVAPLGFFCTVLIQPLPFALTFAALRGFDAWGLGILAGTLAVRWLTRAGIFWRIGDREGMRLLGWLPARDLAGFASWFVALFKRSFEWRHLRFRLTRDGRILPRV